MGKMKFPVPDPDDFFAPLPLGTIQPLDDKHLECECPGETHCRYLAHEMSKLIARNARLRAFLRELLYAIAQEKISAGQ